jgi:serine/threonine protein kinase
MEYAKDCSLRKNLSNIVKDAWMIKLAKLYQIILVLDEMHKKNFIHGNLHHGNILSSHNTVFISDLGSTKYFQSINVKENIYGVLPFIAPEVLRGKPYTKANDIYSFSMIMWEFISGIPPYNDKAYSLQLGLNIYNGERPEIIENIPQCYIDLMKKCWNNDPLKRPNASEVRNIINAWINHICDESISKESEENIVEFYKADKVLQINDLTNIMAIKSHSQTYNTSRLLDFIKQLNLTLDILEQEKYLRCYKYSEFKNILKIGGVFTTVYRASLK